MPDVLHYRRRSKNAMERKERSLRPRIGLVGCNWKPTRERRVDTIRCGRVPEPIAVGPAQVPEQNGLPMQAHYNGAATTQALGHSVPLG